MANVAKIAAGGLLVFSLVGCSWTTPTIAFSKIPAGSTVLAASNKTGGGAIAISINSLEGSDRSVQFLARGKKFADIKSYKFELLDAQGSVARYPAVTTSTIKSTPYTITNLTAPDTLTIRVSAYDASGAIISKSGTGTASVAVADQTVTSTTIALQLADGFVANGDIAATVSVSNGTESSLPAVSIN